MSCGCNNRNRTHPLNNVYSSSCCNQCRCTPCRCVESSCQRSQCESVCTALVSDNAWNVPACDAEAVISFPGLSTILIGTYLYNPTYGRFLVTGFNSINGEVTIENTCLAENAAPGTIVPAGTEFVFSTLPETTEWTDWTPVITTNGTATVSGESIGTARYFTIGTTVWFNLAANFTLSAGTVTEIRVSLPLTGVSPGASAAFPAIAADSGGSQIAAWRVASYDDNILIVFFFNSASWAAGSANIRVQGFYELA